MVSSAHAFTTEKYLRETTLPALERGFAKAGKKPGRLSKSAYPVVCSDGRRPRKPSQADHAWQPSRQIAFYGSTPAYKPVLDSALMPVNCRVN